MSVFANLDILLRTARGSPTVGNFFLGGYGVAGVFESVSISSHIRVQITRESVRLIALIGLNMFRTNIIYWKSLENFSGTRFRLSVLRNWPKIAFFGVFKAFIGNFLYCNLL